MEHRQRIAYLYSRSPPNRCGEIGAGSGMTFNRRPFPRFEGALIHAVGAFELMLVERIAVSFGAFPLEWKDWKGRFATRCRRSLSPRVAS